MAKEPELRDEIGAMPTAKRDVALVVPKEPRITATTFASKARDLAALRDAVVEAAAVGAGLWLSYLFVFFYLAIAVGSVTYRDLFFESPVKLPFLNVDLPLLGFFGLGPLLFLIVHTYVLLHFVLLAGKVGVFHTELLRQIIDEDARARLRRQLPSNIFVQFLAGPREVRTGIVGFMLQLIAWITLVIGPILLLVFFQLTFLPYHHELITWWQRLAVAADLGLLWMLWPSVARGEMTWIWRDDIRLSTVVPATLLSLVPFLLVFTIATFPGEWLDELQSMRVAPTTQLHKFLFEGAVDPFTRKPKSLWSNRLVVPETKFNTEARVGTTAAAIRSLRGRHLEAAVLFHSDLRNVDLAGVQLQGANLDGAQLQGASLLGARLQGASFDTWRLVPAQLQGARLTVANLRGARLNHAQLQGADLDGATLQGASVDFAQLQGVSLNTAQLQGASLEYANLQGANLDGAQLQGASLFSAKLQGASLVGTSVWRAYGDAPTMELVDVDNLELDKTPWPDNTTFAIWRDNILEEIPIGEKRDSAMRRLSALDPPPDKEPKNVLNAAFWKQVLPVQSRGQERERRLAVFLADLACSPDSPPYIARGLLWNGRFKATGSQVTIVEDRLQKGKSDQSACPGVKGFTDEDWASLDKLAAGGSYLRSGARPH